MISINKSILILSFFIISCLHFQNKKKGNQLENIISFAAYNDVNQNKKSYKIIGIKDVDTFVVLMNGKAQVIRLAHIDCPEKKQPFGNKAKQFA